MDTTDGDETWKVGRPFREEMRKLREAKGLTQTDLSRELRAAGMPAHQSTVAKIEDGEKILRLEDAYLIAHVLGTSVVDMVSRRSVNFRSLQKIRDGAEGAYKEIAQQTYEFERGRRILERALQSSIDGGRIDSSETSEFKTVLSNTVEGAVAQGRARLEAESGE